jgi:hypothetical protein
MRHAARESQFQRMGLCLVNADSVAAHSSCRAPVEFSRAATAQRALTELLPGQCGFVRVAQLRRNFDFACGILAEEVLIDRLDEDLPQISSDLEHSISRSRLRQRSLP